MAETHELRLKINAAAAKAGSRDFVRAISSIQKAVNSLTRTSGGMFKKLKNDVASASQAVRAKAAADDKSAASANKASKATRAQGTAAAKQARLSLATAAALRRTSEETVRLSERMRRIGDTAGIARLNTALNQFKTQAGGAANTTLKLRTATSAFADVASRTKISLTKTEAAQSRAARSARDFAAAHRTATAQARAVERQMRSTAGATNATSKAFRRATGSMRGLENAFSGTFQIGSAFRTLLGSITFGTFTRSVFQAGAALQQFRVVMEVATGSVRGATEQMDFIDNMARTLGTNLRTAREDFSKFAISASLAGVETAVARDIFRSVSSAMAVMGRGAEDQRLAFLALEQMLSKNTVSSEELRRQLGERLPGAVNLMARAVGVSTQELQKLLKAGTLVSAEVLPKFAREVDKAFGPGLEKALKRAPAALGRFRNELEFFLSTIADSGFMAALADGFNELTAAMRSPEAREAAVKLGEGLVDLAGVAIKFANVFITNIDKVGQVAKAVIGGLVVRQIVLMANAFVLAGQQALVGGGLIIAAFAGESAAAGADTTVLAANAKARVAVTTGLFNMKTGHDMLLGSMLRTGTATTASTGMLARLSASLVAAGRAARTAAVSLGTASQVLVGLAGPIGIAVTALLLLPVLFSDAGDESSKMADKIDAAIRRAGVSFDTLGSKALRSTSNVQLNATLTDIETLSSAVTTFAEDNSEKVQALSALLAALNGQLFAVNKHGNMDMPRFFEDVQAVEDTFGIHPQEVTTFSRQSRQVISEMSQMTMEALQTGRGFLQLRDDIAEAIVKNPGASPVLRRLADMTEGLALSEAALNKRRMGLVEVYGTNDDRMVKDFATMAGSVVEMRSGLGDLRKRMEELVKTSPQIRDALEKVFIGAQDALGTGASEQTFLSNMLPAFDAATRKIEDLQAKANEAERSSAAAAKSFAETVSKSLTELTDLGGTGFVGEQLYGPKVDENAIKQLQVLLGEYERFRDFSVGMDQISTVFDKFQFPTEEARAFGEELIKQFGALPEGERTYASLTSILDGLGDKYPIEAAADFDRELRNTMRTGRDAGLSYSDLVKELEAYKAVLPTQESRGFIDAIIASARALEEEERASARASVRVAEAARTMRDAGQAGHEGAAGVLAMFQAFNVLESGAAKAVGNLQARLSELERSIELKGMDFISRAVAIESDKTEEYFKTAVNGINESFSETLANIGDVPDWVIEEARQNNERQLAEVFALREEVLAAARTDAGLLPNMEGQPKTATKGSGGKKDTAEEIKSKTEALKDWIKSVKDSAKELRQENDALSLLASGMTKSARAADLLAEAHANGVTLTDAQTSAFIRQIEAAEQLNRALTRLANDPVNDWIESVPLWREAGQLIERDVFQSLSETLSGFVQTGIFDFKSLASSILASVADVLADKAVKELIALFGGNVSGTGEGGFGLGGILSSALGNGGSIGDEPDPFAGSTAKEIQMALATGGEQTAQTIYAAIVQAGEQMRQALIMGGQQSGNYMGAKVVESGTIAGGAMRRGTQRGGTTAASSMDRKVRGSGTTAAKKMGAAIEAGGRVAATQIGAAVGGGSGDGGGLGDFFGTVSTLLGLPFAEGGLTSSPTAANVPVQVPLAAFRHAPSFAAGTTNTSGIPAMLHDNEAVIPLSKGRKVPVELENGGEASRSVVVNQNITIETPNPREFQNSSMKIANTLRRAVEQGRRND